MEEKDDDLCVSLPETYDAGTITTVAAPDAASKKYVIADKMTASANMEMKSCRHHSPLLEIKNEMISDARHKKSRARKITASSLRQAQKSLKKLDSVEKKRIEQKSSVAAAAAVAHIHLLSSAHLYYSAGSSQRRFLCEPCIRGDGEPVVTVVNYGTVKQHYANDQAEHLFSSEVPRS